MTNENNRDCIFDTIRRRHTYGTTGPRVFIELTARFSDGGVLYERDPLAVPGSASRQVTECTIGDIVRLNGNIATISLGVRAPVGIVSVELRSGTDVLRTERTYTAAELGNRVRVLWSGAEYRGRGRNTYWRGRADFQRGRINRFSPINRLNPEMPLTQVGSCSVVWNCVTTGNMMGFDAWLSKEDVALAITTSLGNTSVEFSELGVESHVMEAGGLARKLTVQRLPGRAPATGVGARKRSTRCR